MPTIHFTLNGEKVATAVATHQTIIEVLRDRFDLFGARERRPSVGRMIRPSSFVPAPSQSQQA